MYATTAALITLAVAALVSGNAGTAAWSPAVATALVTLALVLTSASSLGPKRMGRATRLWRVALPLLVAGGVGLIPLPTGIASALIPGSAPLQPGPVATPSLDPDATAYTLARWLLAAGVATWAATLPRRYRKHAPSVLFGVTTAIALFALIHAALGLSSTLGLVAPKDAPDGVFLAPFRNPNHLATLILLGAPSAAWVTQKEWQASAPTLPVAVGGCALLLTGFVAAASPGATLAAVLVVAVAMPTRPRVRVAGLVLCALGTAGTLYWARDAFPGWWSSSPGRRLAQWGDLIPMWRAQPITGWGVGGFELAYAPFRSFAGFRSFHTAHSNVLQWFVDTGLVGAVALGLAAWTWWKRSGRPTPGHRALDLGLLGVLLHALWDFPLTVPLISCLTAAVVGIRLASHAREPTGLRRVATTWGVCALSALAVATHTHHALVDRHAQVVWSEQTTSSALASARALRTLAPWRPERPLAWTWKSKERERRDLVIARADALAEHYPADPAVLRHTTGLLWWARDADACVDHGHAAIARDPWEYRVYVLLARCERLRARPDRALAHYADAIVRWPAETAQGAWVLGELEALTPGPEWWTETLERAPAYWTLYRADQLLAAGEHVLAGPLYEQAAAREPRYAWMPGRARWLAQAGRETEAIELMEQRLAEVPTDGESRKVLVGLHQARGDHEKAIAVLMDGVRLGEDWSAERLLAEKRLHGIEAAFALAESYRTSGRLTPRSQLVLARLHLEQGNPVACLHELEDLSTRTEAPRGLPALRARCREACQSCD